MLLIKISDQERFAVGIIGVNRIEWLSVFTKEPKFTPAPILGETPTLTPLPKTTTEETDTSPESS